jgi:hypothetical protein
MRLHIARSRALIMQIVMGGSTEADFDAWRIGLWESLQLVGAVSEQPKARAP